MNENITSHQPELIEAQNASQNMSAYEHGPRRPDQPWFTPDPLVLKEGQEPDAIAVTYEAYRSHERWNTPQTLNIETKGPALPENSTVQENLPTTPEEIVQLAEDPKGFFRSRWEKLTGLWQKTKEAKTTEVIIKKPARLIGSVAVFGAAVATYAAVSTNRAIGRGVDAYMAGILKQEEDKKSGYDPNSLQGRLTAKLHKRPFNPRPPQSHPVLDEFKTTAQDRWEIRRQQRLSSRLK